MKTQTFLLLSVLLINHDPLSAEETDILSAEKQNTIQEQQNINDSEHEKLRYNWIAPLNLNASYSYDKSASGDYHSDTKRVSAAISQDVFRSGGIFYQIAYADARFESQSLALKRQVASLNQQLFVALLNYRRYRIELEQSQKRLDNYDIEIFIKRQLYDAGKTDITQLNNSLMDRSGELKNFVLLQSSIAEQRYEISKLSDIDPDSLIIPTFSLMREDEYLQNHLDLRYSRAQSRTYENLYRVTDSSYLPSVALNADAGHQNYDPKELSGSYSGNFYSAGVLVSLPLAYNASSTIQEARSQYLKQVADTADKLREQKASYAQVLERIESYQHYIDITTKNLALYDELIAITQAGLDAGTKTGYDLKTLQNTKAIEEYTIKINEINIQIELAKLHFALNTLKDL